MTELHPNNSEEYLLEDKEFTQHYNEVREAIERDLGFQLSNIELVGLKIITKEVIRQVEEERREHVSGMDRISDYFGEIFARWYPQFLGVRYDELPFKKGPLDDATKEYLRRKHEEQHLI